MSLVCYKNAKPITIKILTEAKIPAEVIVRLMRMRPDANWNSHIYFNGDSWHPYDNYDDEAKNMIDCLEENGFIKNVAARLKDHEICLDDKFTKDYYFMIIEEEFNGKILAYNQMANIFIDVQYPNYGFARDSELFAIPILVTKIEISGKRFNG